MELPDVIASGNIHRCREIQPFEATVYSLQADKLERFAAISKVELTVTVDAKSEEVQRKKKKQFSSLELPVDFSKESVAQVRECSRQHRPRPKQRTRPIKLLSMLSTQCRSCLGTSPYKSIFIGLGVGISLCQCKHTVRERSTNRDIDPKAQVSWCGMNTSTEFFFPVSVSVNAPQLFLLKHQAISLDASF